MSGSDNQDFESMRIEYIQLYWRLREDATKNHIAYGRWLIASLLAIHGGALISISQLGDRAGSVFLVSGVWFLAGLMLAMVCGFCAWINFQIAESIYSDWSAPELLHTPDKWPDFEKHSGWKLTCTLWCAALAGIVSWLFIAIGASQALTVFVS